MSLSVSVISLSLSLSHMRNVFILPGPKHSLVHEECSLQNSTPRFYHWEGIFFDRFQWETPFLIFFLQNTFKCVKQTNYKHTKYWIFDEVDSSDNQTSIHELKTDNFTPAFENGQSRKKTRKHSSQFFLEITNKLSLEEQRLRLRNPAPPLH